MSRLTLLAVTVALAAGRCVAEPIGVPTIQHYEDMDSNQQEHVDTYVNTMEAAPTTTSTKAPGCDMLSRLPKLVEKQLQLQDNLMNKVIKDIEEYLKEATRAFGFEDTQSSPVAQLNNMLEKISTRMATALQGANELMANSEVLDRETLVSATIKFMKEVRVQDIVVDSLFASLRGTQTNAFVTGTTGVEEKDAYTAAKRAEELLSRMYHNLRAAGISEEDVGKFGVKPGMADMQMRNMGIRSIGYDYAYASPFFYSYPYAYSYPSYAYSNPYYSYSYPYYRYSYGYPYAFGLRRLRPNCPGCPPVPTTGVPEAAMGVPPQQLMGVPPQPVVPPFRSMGQMPISMERSPMAGMGFSDPMIGSGHPTPYEPNMGYPLDALTGMNGMEETPSPYGGMPAGYRNLAPMELPGLFPESGMPAPPFGLGPIGGTPF